MNHTFLAIDPAVTERIDQLNSEAWALNRSDPRKAFSIAETSFRESNELDYQKGKGLALKTLGACHIWLARYDEALSTSFQALEVLRKAMLSEEEAQVHYNIGTNFYYMADYDNALKYFMNCLKLNEKIGNYSGQADARNGLGTVYYTIEENEKALEYLQSSLELCEKTGDSHVMHKVLDGLGHTYYNLGKYDKALDTMFRCLDIIRQKGGTKQVEAFVLDGIGKTYSQLGEFNQALEYFGESLAIRKEIGFRSGEAETLSHIGHVYSKTGEHEKAEELLLESLGIATEIQSKEWIYQSAQSLSDLFEATGDHAKALSYFKIFHKTREDVRNEKAAKRSRGIELQVRMEQVEKEKELLRQQHNELEKIVDDMVLLSDIGKKITSSLSTEVIISTVYETVNKLMDAPCFGIGVVNETEGRIVFPGYIEKGKTLVDAGYSLKEKNRLAIRCYIEQEEIVINDFHAEINRYFDTVPEVVVGERPESIVYLPVTYRNKKLGVITVQSFKKNVFQNYQINLIRNLAVYAAIAFENAASYKSVEEEVKIRTSELLEQKEALEKSYQHTRLLSAIGQQLTSKIRFEEIFRELHGNVNQLMDAACFGVRIFHPDKNMVEYKYEMEKDEQHEVSWVSMDDDDNYSVWCIKNRKEIFINDNLKEYQRYVKQIRVVSGDMPHSLIFYPLILGERTLGVITIQSFERNAYTAYHLDILKTLASYTAIALDNAYLYENLEHKVQERTSEVIRQKEIIEDKNKHITDSIRYAKRIQEAILPATKVVKSYLEDSFIFYRPKDIVSGDFYWMEQADGKILFSVVDCTGHGVPGAFMSIMGHSQLGRAVNEKNESKPSRILDYLNQSITESLNRRGETGVRDGMDLALCSLDTESLQIEFAGAYNPLYIVNNKGLREIKGDKLAIGTWTEGQPGYTNHLVQLEKGDCIYVFSDGFADQFGGEKGKKFMNRSFKNLLVGLHDQPMEQQFAKLSETFESWKGDYEQVDDICVIGVRV